MLDRLWVWMSLQISWIGYCFPLFDTALYVDALAVAFETV
jgi:hypothetical protein